MLEANAHLLGDNVLEVGSRMHNPAAWYLNNRDLAKGKWTGVDFQAGLNVDVVGNIETGEGLEPGFTGIVCSEVLEHVRRPWLAMETMRRLLQPGGHLLITTLTTFHLHGYPDDYFRYTPSGLKVLMEDAGFECLSAWNEGEVKLALKNHDETVFHKIAPLQVFAVARKPE
jgi:SAM-dependent methyltransferase